MPVYLPTILSTSLSIHSLLIKSISDCTTQNHSIWKGSLLDGAERADKNSWLRTIQAHCGWWARTEERGVWVHGYTSGQLPWPDWSILLHHPISPLWVIRCVPQEPSVGIGRESCVPYWELFPYFWCFSCVTKVVWWHADHYDVKMPCHLILSKLANKCGAAVLAGIQLPAFNFWLHLSCIEGCDILTSKELISILQLWMLW